MNYESQEEYEHFEGPMEQGVPQEEETANTLAGRAEMLGLGKLASYIWEACCLRWGSGGTPEANGAYEQIMKRVLEELAPTNR